MLRGSVTYCDDLRVENNGKLLLIGVYNTDLTFPEPFPNEISQIILLIKIRASVDIGGETCFIRVFTPDNEEEPNVSHSFALPRPTEEEMRHAHRAYTDGPINMTFTFPLTLSNIIIEKKGFIKTEIQVNDTCERLQALRIQVVEAIDPFHEVNQN